MLKPVDARVTVKIVKVSVADAIRLRKTCHFPNQRAIRDLNTQRLGLEMEKGRFVQGTPVFICVVPDGTQYIVNGNHTLEAIAYSGKAQTLVFIFLQVDSFEQAAAVYSCFDVHKARTWADALKATGRDQKIPNAKQVSAAVKLIMSDFKYSPNNFEANSSRMSNFDATDQYEDAAIMLDKAMKGAPALNQRILLRQGVMAVALECVRYSPQSGIQFWGSFVKDDGLVSEDPRKALLRWLLDHPPGKSCSTHLMARGCAHAWNQWWKGMKIKILRPRTSGKFFLTGTPWDGNRGPDADEISGPAPRPNRKPPTGDNADSVLPDIFETGMRVTENGLEPVVLHRPAGEVGP
jgi:hypothetical protein